MIRLILADDHLLVRNGIKLLLTEDPELDVVAEALNGQEVLDLLNGGLLADILLLDMNMPVMDGIALLPIVREKYPLLKVIFLSMLDNPEVVFNTIRKGASAYLFKNVNAMELLFAVKYVHDGGRYLCSEIQFKMLEQKSSDRDLPVNIHKADDFTEREMEILQLIAIGHTNAEIAEKLFLSKRTVEGHRQLLLNKTQSRNSAHLIKTATVMGLV